MEIHIFFISQAYSISHRSSGDVFDIDVMRERPQIENELGKIQNIQENTLKILNLSVRPELAN